MVTKSSILHITLWWGIIADLIEAIRMAIPQLFIATVGVRADGNEGFRFALLYGAPVMLGWSMLLFWADRKPIERKGIFACLIPVIIGYFIVEITGIHTGVLTLRATVPTFVLQTILLLLSILSFVTATNLAVRNSAVEHSSS